MRSTLLKTARPRQTKTKNPEKRQVMKAEQLSIFVENRAGRLAEIIHLLAEHGINIRALSLADTSDFGVLRMILCEQEKAENLLKAKGFTVGKSVVVATEFPDRAGELDKILQLLSTHGVNVEYMYACSRRNQESAIMIFRFDKTDSAAQILRDKGYKLIPQAELCLI